MPVRWPTAIQADRHYGQIIPRSRRPDTSKKQADPSTLPVDRKYRSGNAAASDVDVTVVVIVAVHAASRAAAPEKYVRICAAAERTREIPDHWTDPRACIL